LGLQSQIGVQQVNQANSFVDSRERDHPLLPSKVCREITAEDEAAEPASSPSRNRSNNAGRTASNAQRR
jgi:hypothetical protein